MGHTRKRHYDRYTLAYKQQAVRLASHPDVMAKDVAESLGLHPVRSSFGSVDTLIQLIRRFTLSLSQNQRAEFAGVPNCCDASAESDA